MPKIVHIRPVLEAELDLLELLYEDPGEALPYSFFGYHGPGKLRREARADSAGLQKYATWLHDYGETSGIV